MPLATFVHPQGFEPRTTVPKTVVISISPQVRGFSNVLEYYHATTNRQEISCYDQNMKGKTDHLTVGVLGEHIARDFLMGNGFAFVDANIKNTQGEIDILMKKNGWLYFIEVKTVTDEEQENPHNDPKEKLTSHKIHKLHKAILRYLAESKQENIRWQLDAVLVYLDRDNQSAEVEYLEHISREV